MRTMNFSLTLPLSLWFILCLITGLSNAAVESTTDVVCRDEYKWMKNSRLQSPCMVATYLEGACDPGYWNVPELESGFMYVGPLRNESNICLCSSVVYNAVSSCAACQGKPWVSWLYWIKECVNTHITVANYKVDIPLRTAIPRWMYQDPTQQPHGSFNPDPAFLIASQQQPDITSDNQAGYSPPTPTASPGSGNSAKIGAIVGGVVGGIGILTAGVILGRWFLRRRYIARSSLAPSKRYITEWSKEVPYRQVLSRWAGTSYGSDSVVGEPAKGRDMMTPTSTLPASYPNTPDGQKSSPYDGQQQSTTQPLVRDLAAS